MNILHLQGRQTISNFRRPKSCITVHFLDYLTISFIFWERQTISHFGKIIIKKRCWKFLLRPFLSMFLLQTGFGFIQVFLSDPVWHFNDVQFPRRPFISMHSSYRNAQCCIGQVTVNYKVIRWSHDIINDFVGFSQFRRTYREPRVSLCGSGCGTRRPAIASGMNVLMLIRTYLFRYKFY